MYYDALGAAAENRLGAGARDRLDAIADSVIPGLSTRDAWPVLRRNLDLAVLALGGADPHELLVEALAKGSVDDAADPAAVLDYRIDPAGTHSAGIGVLRWLPAIPAALADDPQWGAYLARREQLVDTLADADPRTRPQLDQRHRTSVGAPADHREHGADRRNRRVPRRGRRRRGRHPPDRAPPVPGAHPRRPRPAAAPRRRRHRPAQRRHHPLEQPHRRHRPAHPTDAYWPQLAAHLAQATRTTADLRHIITTAARQGPLPDELPAAALWWRIAGALSPTATLATTHSRLRPAWITDVDRVFGAVLAETITSDPAWPGLVAAISAADPHKWTPADLLTLAAEQLADAADDTHPIPPGDYARLITYTVDAFTHRLQARLGVDVDDIPMPDAPPVDPSEEEQFPPDPDTPHPVIDEHTRVDDYFDVTPPDHYTLEYGSNEFDGLQFDDLSANRPTPELRITMETLTSLRDEYRFVCEEITTLDADIRAGNGPAMRAAAQELMRLRRQVDADRPYAHAVTAVMEQWADADAAYNDVLRMIEHARTHLDTLLPTPGADELDIASARADLAFHTRRLPEHAPSQQFQQALADAQAARTAAAAGDHIATEHDIVTARGDAERADLAARAALHQRRQNLRRQLDRADRDVATAFAAAQTATSDTLAALLDSARSEVELLRAAGHLDFDQTPLHIPASTLAAHDQAPQTGSKHWPHSPTDSATPAPTFTTKRPPQPSTHCAARRTPPTARCCGSRSPTTPQPRRAPLTWPTPSPPSTEAHRRISDQQWALPPGAIVVIDNPASAEPAHLADIAHHTATAGARAIILDPADAHRGPSTPALRLLSNVVPWTTRLSTTDVAPEDRRLAPTPAVTLADRLGRTRLSEPWRQLLTEYDTAARAVRAAQRRHLALGWRTHDVAIEEPDHTIDAVDIDD